MDNLSNEKKLNPGDFADLSVDSILAEFKAEEEVDAIILDEANEHTRRIVMKNEGQAIGQSTFCSSEDYIESVREDRTSFETRNTRKADIDFTKTALSKEDAAFGDAFIEPVFTPPEEKRANSYAADVDDTVVFVKKSRDDEASIWAKTADSEQGGEYAPAGEYEKSEYAQDNRPERETDIREKLFSPLIGAITATSLKREEKRKAEKARAEEESKRQLPEMSPEKATRLYVDQAISMRLRCLFATALCLVLVWLSYGFPAMGLLGSSPLVRTLVCLIFELVVMLVGLDIFTNGIVSLFKKSVGLESLIAVSCVVSIADAIYIIISGNTDDGLPFCAVSALSMTFALWGSYLNCKTYAIAFRTASIPKAPSVILSEDGGEETGRVLVKVSRPVTGFVRKTEEADIFEKTYSLFSPLFIIFALVLSLFCFFASKECNNFIHTLSAGLSVCASFSAVFGFAFPFYVLTKRLARSGVAIAGYAGCADLGRISQVVIKDKDIFPVRTLSISNLNVLEGFYPDKVISFTASMVAAAGMGIASVFTELMKKNGYSMQKVEDFACHEGGGIIARINGDQVYVGSSSFMQLMGIRIQKGTGSNSAVYTAINDALAGVFEINYVPVTSVQKGLVTLLRGRIEPVFAIRDFNITPLLVKQKFRLPKESYDFPSFADRYTISSPETEEGGSIAAMFARGGLNSVAGLIKRAKTLYTGLLLCSVLSVLGAFMGMILMLAMCWSGVYDSASVGNAISFMILWLVPVFIIALGLRR
ncbi:MAG: hypothetical protein KBI01_07620 [Oscillospiraceae bacterium]|nr:hypothetical protein [Oscillospiraceae bacterium]